MNLIKYGLWVILYIRGGTNTGLYLFDIIQH